MLLARAVHECMQGSTSSYLKARFENVSHVTYAFGCGRASKDTRISCASARGIHSRSCYFCLWLRARCGRLATTLLGNFTAMYNLRISSLRYQLSHMKNTNFRCVQQHSYCGNNPEFYEATLKRRCIYLYIYIYIYIYVYKLRVC